MSLELDFILSELWILSWSASVQRANLFNKEATEYQRRQFRNEIISFLNNDILPQYERDISEEQHVLNIQQLSDEGTIKGGDILGLEGYKIGVAQKLLNLQLKYLWCLGLISEPPHCPVDRIIINETDLKDPISWTKITDISEYLQVIFALKRIAGYKSLAVWELEIYNRRRNSSGIDQFDEDSPQNKKNKSYPFKSHGKGQRFRVDVNTIKRSLVFSYPVKLNGKQRPPDEFTLDEVEKICSYLMREFKGAAFPLANNVKLLGNDNEDPGLGMAIRTLPASVPKAQASSYLGPYLEEVGLFQLVNRHPAKWILISDSQNVKEKILIFHKIA